MRSPSSAVHPSLTPSEFPFLRSQGTASNVGRAHGEAFSAQVRASVAACRRRVEEVLDQPWSAAMQFARDQRTHLSELDAGLIAEMEGIAEGADLDPLAIVALHVRTALSRMVERSRDAASPSSDPTSDGLECTTIAVLPEATASGRTLAAQNWDMHASYQPRTVVIEQHIDGEPGLMFVTEAGMVFSHGMNDAGLVMLGNALHSHLGGPPDQGVPVQVARRRAMRTSSVAAGRHELEVLDRAHSVNHLLADTDGAAVDLEFVPGRIYDVAPDDGILVHTNHFLNQQALDEQVELTMRVRTDSRHRADRARSFLGGRAGRIDIADLQQLLRDHDGSPECVCRHHDEKAPPTATSTVSSTVFDPAAGRLWNAPSPSCVTSPTMHEFS